VTGIIQCDVLGMVMF